MRVVIQRVTSASVTIDGLVTAAIEQGLLVLLGIEQEDTAEDIEWLCKKIVQLRIFADEAGLMNRSIQEVDGEILLVSQFTLFAQTRKGNRPSFIRSAKPEQAIPIYHQVIACMQQSLEKPIKTGVFGADMKLQLTNDGPVTIVIDTKNKE